jgi:hypothetical protein
MNGHPYVVASLDVSALIALIGAHAGFFPAFAAFLASVWYLIQIIAYFRGQR